GWRLEGEAGGTGMDFGRANAEAARLGRASGQVTNVGYRAADFSAACPDGSTVSRDRMHGRIAHLVIAGRVSAARAAHLAAHDRGVVTIAIPVAEVATGAAR